MFFVFFAEINLVYSHLKSSILFKTPYSYDLLDELYSINLTLKSGFVTFMKIYSINNNIKNK